MDRDSLLALLARLPDAVLLLDRDWRILFANDQARRISRVALEDLYGKSYWELYPETLGTEVERTSRAVMDSGAPARLEHFYAPFEVWLLLSIFPIAEGIAIHYRDVTALKRAEAQRDVSLRQLHQLLEAANDSIVCIDRSWKCTFANRVAHRLLNTDDLIGKDLWLDFPGNQQDPFASNYRTTMHQRLPTQFEAYYAEPLDIWFKVWARPYEDGIVIFSNDITLRKRAEAHRDTYARQLEQVFAATSDSVISLDRHWTITFANEKALQLLGRTDLVGKKLWREYPAHLGSEYENHLRRCMEQGIEVEFQGYYPEPLHAWFNVQCRPADDGIVLFFRDISARVERDRLVKQQRDLLAFVQQAARTAFWTMHLATRRLTFAPDSFPVFGHPLAQLDTMEKFHAILHPDDRDPFTRKMLEAAETPLLVTCEFRVIDSDGNTLWVEARCKAAVAAVAADEELVVGGLSIDITDRKRSQEALAASEERYRVLAELSPQFLWIGSPQGDVTYANQGFLDYLGFTLEDIRSGRWLDAFVPEDRSLVRDTWIASVTTGADYDIEARMLSSTGEPRWWWIRALPLRNETGSIVNWLGASIDIHDRKTAADALHQKQLETERQRAELETVYRTAPVGLALYDPVDFRFLRLNDRQAEFVGQPPETILGRTLSEVASVPGAREIFEEVAQGKAVRNAIVQGEMPGRPGEPRFWTVNCFPVYDADGSIQAISAAALDITIQKKAEQALIESEKLAAVGRLASSISHEINNPLEAVTNLLYLLAHSASLPADLRPLVDIAQDELQRVCQIATQTLRFHRQAARATLITPQDLVTAVLNLYQGRLANSSITVETRYTTDAPLLCFENDIRQVLNNLIANAIDSMRRGGHLVLRARKATGSPAGDPKRSPSATTMARPVDGIRLTVADTGHGMSSAVLARIFEPFYTTKALNGTGLGLWISHGIIARHRGRISVRSSQHPRHHGTVFSLFLPHIAEAEIEEADLIPSTTI